MKTKRWYLYLIAIVIFMVAECAFVGFQLLQYPQQVIYPDALYGAQQENLKDFSLNEDGTLTSLSNDPWIFYQFQKGTKVHQISIYYDQAEGLEESQFFFLPLYNVLDVEVKDNRTEVTLPDNQSWVHELEGIRFDLAEEEGLNFQINRIVLNGYGAVVRSLLPSAVGMLLLFLALLFEIWVWARIFDQERVQSEAAENQLRRPVGRMVLLAAELLCKAALIALLFDHMLAQPDSLRMSCWVLLSSIQALHILGAVFRWKGWNRNLLLGMSVAPVWAGAQFAGMELSGLTHFAFQNAGNCLLNLLLFCAVVWIFMLLLRNPALTYTVAGVLFGIWSAANHYFGELRGSPLQFSDMTQAGTALNVIGSYRLELGWSMTVVILLQVTIALGVYAAFGWRKAEKSWKRWLGAAAVAACAGVAFVAAIPTFGVSQSWDIAGVCREYGYPLAFCSYAKATGGEKPSGYSAQKVSQIADDYSDDSNYVALASQTDKKLPNVIAVMNETFSDLPDIYGFETDVDPLANIHSLDNAITGRVLVSVYGGGTANTEYEFLTGNSLYYLPVSSCPYIQYMSKEQESLAWYLQSIGYSVRGYHPFGSNGYHRDQNYPRLGMDLLYGLNDDLPYQDNIRSFLSDESDFKNVEWLYEHRDTSQPFFIFNVTMQNHGSYSTDTPAVEPTVIPTDESLHDSQLLEYLALIRESDMAFQQLVDYFSQVDEDTIILMFGDHQPRLETEILEELESRYQERPGYASAENMIYQASFVMWANFDLEERADVLTSPNYLRALLLDQADIPLSTYDHFLLDLQEKFPALNATSCLDGEQNWYERGEVVDPDLTDYSYLIYNNVFDKRHLNASMFYE